MRIVTLHLPDTFQMNEEELTMTLAAKLYGDGKLSLGQAADVAGMTKYTFAELLEKYGVSIFNYPASDLSGDVRNA